MPERSTQAITIPTVWSESILSGRRVQTGMEYDSVIALIGILVFFLVILLPDCRGPEHQPDHRPREGLSEVLRRIRTTFRR